MREPEVLDLSSCYHDGGQRKFDRATVEGLRYSLSHCHDVNRRLIRANDELQRQFTRQWIWIKVLGGANAVAWTIVAGLVVWIVTNW